MIQIIVPQKTNRLQYIVDVIFGSILQTAYKIVSEDDFDIHQPRIYFGSPDEKISIPDAGLLFEEHIHEPQVSFSDSLPYLDFEYSKSGYTFPYDVFSISFYILTEYYNWNNTQFDAHGRYDESRNPLIKHNLTRYPLLHLYAEDLWKHIKTAYPNAQRNHRNFEYKVSFDIDAPWLYKNRLLWLNVAGALNNIVKSDFKSAKKRLNVLSKNEHDPFDTFDFIQKNLKPHELLFFFLINRTSKFDDRFTYKNIAYKRLIKTLSVQYEFGIHPSYNTFLDKYLLHFETNKLAEIAGQSITKSRMHFLKYRLPQTYHSLIAAGITDDYTSCLATKIGFKHGIAISFPWFDLDSNSITSLQIHPTIAMDRTLQKYMKLSPEEALSCLKEYILLTAQYKGCFILLLHNSSLSEWKEWQGWRNVFEKTISFLRECKENGSSIS